MTTFDASYDMPAAARRRNEILDATPITTGPTDRELDLAARDRRYVALRLQGVSQDAAWEEVWNELAPAGVVKSRWTLRAYDEEDVVYTLDELREQVGL